MIANVGTMRGGPCSLWPRRFPTDLCHVPPVVLVVTAVALYYHLRPGLYFQPPTLGPQHHAFLTTITSTVLRRAMPRYWGRCIGIAHQTDRRRGP